MTGPMNAANLPQPLSTDAGLSAEQMSNWQPAQYSLQRGIDKDPLHIHILGPKAHVPEEFLQFGNVKAREGSFRTAVWMAERKQLHFALGAGAQKSAWLNGQSIGTEAPGYLWVVPVELQAGMNILEWRLTAEKEGALRAYWALLQKPENFLRPERMTSPDVPRKDSQLRFSLEFDVPFQPHEFTVQIAADAPVRVLVNDVEVGRQGGFDPYFTLARVQPYNVTSGRQGKNSLVLEVQDTGNAVAVLADGIVRGAGQQQVFVVSGSHWHVQRDNGSSQPVKLHRQQWLDPAWSHLWRRPHPLPGAASIEDTPADDTVLPIVPDAFFQRAV